MKKIHVTSLGCPKNLVDTEIMLGILDRDGWQVAEEPEDADVLLVNTCGFIQPAVEEGVDEILDLAELKVQSPEKKLVVTGCMVQRYRESLRSEIPEIDLLVGTEGIQSIAVFLREMAQPGIHIPEVPFLMDSSLPRTLATPWFRAWMKLTEGCNNRCAYCLIPSIRGDLRSRPLDDLVREAKHLEERGVQELSLIAQDLTAYGTEFGQGSALVPLLEQLLQKTSIPWLRLLYLYPTGLDDPLLDLIAGNARIVPYLDAPFQHVSTNVLQRMNRRYTRDDLLSFLERVRGKVPDIALRTTFLVGFPGETERDVEELAGFVADARLDHVGIFTYANEEGAPSEHFPDQVDEEEKARRAEYIMSLQAEVSEGIQKKYIGTIQPVLVEGVSRETDLLLEGRTRYQAPEIDGCVYINDGTAREGDIVAVRITEHQVYDLVGEIVEKENLSRH